MRKAHLVTRLGIKEAHHERTLVGMLAIELIGQSKQHLVISPVGELVFLTLLQAVIEQIVELRLREFRDGICHLVTGQSCKTHMTVVADAHLTGCTEDLKSHIVVSLLRHRHHL